MNPKSNIDVVEAMQNVEKETPAKTYVIMSRSWYKTLKRTLSKVRGPWGKPLVQNELPAKLAREIIDAGGDPGPWL